MSWTAAVSLRLGDELLTRGGEKLFVASVVSSCKQDLGCQTVYNFEIKDYHSYFIGEKNAWVHNSSKRKYKEADVKTIKHSEEYDDNVFWDSDARARFIADNAITDFPARSRYYQAIQQRLDELGIDQSFFGLAKIVTGKRMVGFTQTLAGKLLTPPSLRRLLTDVGEKIAHVNAKIYLELKEGNRIDKIAEGFGFTLPESLKGRAYLSKAIEYIEQNSSKPVFEHYLNHSDFLTQRFARSFMNFGPNYLSFTLPKPFRDAVRREFPDRDFDFFELNHRLRAGFSIFEESDSAKITSLKSVVPNVEVDLSLNVSYRRAMEAVESLHTARTVEMPLIEMELAQKNNTRIGLQNRYKVRKRNWKSKQGALILAHGIPSLSNEKAIAPLEIRFVVNPGESMGLSMVEDIVRNEDYAEIIPKGGRFIDLQLSGANDSGYVEAAKDMHYSAESNPEIAMSLALGPGEYTTLSGLAHVWAKSGYSYVCVFSCRNEPFDDFVKVGRVFDNSISKKVNKRIKTKLDIDMAVSND
jgi:hypothetical protein